MCSLQEHIEREIRARQAQEAAVVEKPLIEPMWEAMDCPVTDDPLWN